MWRTYDFKIISDMAKDIHLEIGRIENWTANSRVVCRSDAMLKQHLTLLSVHSDNQKHTYKNYILTSVQSSSITHRALWYPQLQGVSIRARAKTVQNVRVLVKWRIQITIWGINLWQTIHILVFLQVYILWTLNYEITSFSVLLSTKLLDNSEHDITITSLLCLSLSPSFLWLVS